MVMIIGMFNVIDCGVQLLCESVFGVKLVVNLLIQGQCELLDDNVWFCCMVDVGIDILGMYLEVVMLEVCKCIMFGKVIVFVECYMEVFVVVVEVFGCGQVSIYILVGLGDSDEVILKMSEQFIVLGVYFFVVLFVLILGMLLEDYFLLDVFVMCCLLVLLVVMLEYVGM